MLNRLVNTLKVHKTFATTFLKRYNLFSHFLNVGCLESDSDPQNEAEV